MMNHNHTVWQNTSIWLTIAAFFILLLGWCVLMLAEHEPTLSDEAPSVLATRVSTVPEATAQAIISPRPVYFIENQGQAPAEVGFHAEGAGHTVLFQRDAVILRRSSTHDASASQVVLHFVDAASDLVLEGLEPQAGRAHFYRGRDAGTWRTDVPTFGSVHYRGLYPGIDLVYRGNDGVFKSDFYVAPESDPAQIRLRYEGAEDLYLRADGALVLATPLGELIEAAPVVYQKIAGQRVPVEARYALHDDGTVGFTLGTYDPAKPLVIDPEIVFETTFGGSNLDTANAIVMAPDGTILVTGYTQSNDFPTVNAYDDSRGPTPWDIFITKIDRETGDLIYSTYLGGDTPVPGFSSASNEATGIAVDDAGTTYLIGETSASDFPTMNPIQGTNAGNSDIIIARFTPDGMLTFSTYLGGAGFDQSGKIALNGTALWITGTTDTQGGTFPTVNPIQGTPGGFDDAFVARLEPGTGDSSYDLTFSTFLGGSDSERGNGIAVDGEGDVIVGGQTFSDDFPLTNAMQDAHGGNTDGFMAKLAGDDLTLTYSTFLGGNNFEGVADVAVDAQGNAYGVGSTSSADFPTQDAAQAELQGDQDAFLSAFDPTGTLIFSTCWGGSDFEAGTSVTAQDGKVMIGGNTESSDFPMTNPLEDAPETPNGFLTEVSETGEVQTSTTVNGFVRATAPAQESGTWLYTTEQLTNIIVGIIHTEGDGAAPLLEVTKTSGREEPVIIATGVKITFTITVTNTGDADALGVQLVDQTSFLISRYGSNPIEYISNDGNCAYRVIYSNFGEGTIELICDIGVLAPGISRTINANFRAFLATDKRILSRAEATSLNANRSSAQVSIQSIIPRPADDTGFNFVAALFFPENRSDQLSARKTTFDAIDIYVDSVRVVDDLARQTSTKPPFELSRLEPRVDVVESTAPDLSDPVATFKPNFLVGEGEEAYVPDASALFFVEVEDDSLDLLVKHDVRTEAEDPAQVEFFLAHAAFNAAPFDLRLADGAILFDNVDPRDLTDYAALPPGVHDLHLTTADGTLEDIFRLDLNASQGAALTLALVPVEEAGSGKQGTVALLAFDAEGNALDVPIVTAAENTDEVPACLVLEGNYPNPFNPATTIRFDVPVRTRARLEVINALGQVVATLVNEDVGPGSQQTTFHANGLPSGIYFYRLTAGSFRATRAMMLLK